MITQALEFYRLANAQPQHADIERRREAAEKLAAKLLPDANRGLLLIAIQGIVTGFDKAPISQGSSIVTLIVETIRSNDLSLPGDLTENANDLRAVASMAVQAILTGDSSNAATVAAMALRSALSLRQSSSQRYLKWVLDALLRSADDVLVARGLSRRRPTRAKLDELLSLTDPEDPTETWTVLVPAVQEAIKEVSVRAEVDREELNMLWWMFSAYSAIAGRALDRLAPTEIATAVGLELAELSLLPPTPNSSELVKRVIVRSLPPATEEVSLKELCGAWQEGMRNKIDYAYTSGGNVADKFPAVFPLTKAVVRVDETGTKVNLDKSFVQATGFALTLTARPEEWGAQIFREAVLKRHLANDEER